MLYTHKRQTNSFLGDQHNKKNEKTFLGKLVGTNQKSASTQKNEKYKT